MKLTNEYIGLSGVKYLLEYEECDDFSVLPEELCTQCYAVCFIKNTSTFAIVRNKRGTWSLIGGTIEKNETFEETLKREILEEGNIQALDIQPLGFQKCTDTRDGSFFYQLRFTCNGVRLGEFVSDPDDKIDMVAFVTQNEYKNYFDWGKIGEQIIQKAHKIRKI